MSLLSVLFCAYGAVALSILVYIVLATLFGAGRRDKLIPYYFGYVRAQHGLCRLILEGAILALLWLPLTLVIVGIYLHSRHKRKQKPPRK